MQLVIPLVIQIIFPNTLFQVGAYTSYMLSLLQIKSSLVLPSGLVSRSANWFPDDTCFVRTILSSSFLQTI